MWRTLCFVARALRERAAANQPSARIQALQAERLRRMVAWAIRRSPFYAEHFRGVSPDRLSLSQLPTVTKAQLMSNLDQVLTDRTLRRADLEGFLGDPAQLGRWYRGRYALCRTSGTQGEPAVIVQDRAAVEL